jgi:hypothetical protein
LDVALSRFDQDLCASLLIGVHLWFSLLCVSKDQTRRRRTIRDALERAPARQASELKHTQAALMQAAVRLR